MVENVSECRRESAHVSTSDTVANLSGSLKTYWQLAPTITVWIYSFLFAEIYYKSHRIIGANKFNLQILLNGALMCGTEVICDLGW